MSPGSLWGRRDDPPATLVAALADLERLAAERPELATPARQLAPVLRAAFGRPPSDPPSFDAPAVLAGWREGVPAFRSCPPALDRAGLSRRAESVCDALREANPSAARLRSAIRRGEVDLPAWWRQVLAGRDDAPGDQAAARGLDPALAVSVLRLALLPALARASEALAPIRPEGGWAGGGCPHCGTWPVLAESRGLEQSRWLRCGLCAADWPGDRLRCPSCGETDHKALGYRYVEGEQDRQRLAHCEACGMTLKVVSTLTPLSAPGLLVAELATAHLDAIAETGAWPSRGGGGPGDEEDLGPPHVGPPD